MARRRLTLEEYRQQVSLMCDIASVAQDAARLYLHLWDVPDCLTSIINAFGDLDRLLFPQGLPWVERVDDATKTRRRIHHLTASEFWAKPCKPGEEITNEARVAPWQRLHDTLLALLHHYDRVLADHGWGPLIAECQPPVRQPELLSPSVSRLAGTAELLADLARREDERIAALDPQPRESVPAPEEASGLDIERHVQRTVAAIGDENAVRILGIAQRSDWSGERKMEEILRLDSRFAGKDSKQWGQLLDVSPNAVRGYDRWKRLQQAKNADL
jgi:hypothetical protein